MYEDNIGLLTPIIAQELKDAELTYPADWIEDAFREAVSYNKRNWRYVQRILEKWAANGRGTDSGGKLEGYAQPPRNPRDYVSGELGRFIKR